MNIQAGNKYIEKHWSRYQLITVKCVFNEFAICDIQNTDSGKIKESPISLTELNGYLEYSDELWEKVLFVNTVLNEVEYLDFNVAEELWAKGYRKVLE